MIPRLRNAVVNMDEPHQSGVHPVGPPPVVLLVDALANNGAVHIMLYLAERWAGSGARLAVIQRLPEAAQLSIPDGVAVRQLTKKRQRLSRSLPVVMFRLLGAARGRAAIVSGSEIGIGVILGFLAARLSRRRFVVSVHADLDDALNEWIPQRFHRLFYAIHRRADGAICVAPGVVAPLLRNGLPESRIRVIRNGIDIAAVRIAANGPENLIGTGLPVVLATGRLAHQKGNDLLIRAHARVVHDHPHRILFLNDGPELEALQALAAELGVTRSVEFAGAVRSPMPTVARADVFCLPSRHEGLPLALLEAVALGVPCIAADCSDGVRAALDDGRIGVLVPVDDVDALVGALSENLANPGPLRAKAALGPVHAQTFDSTVMANGWAAAIAEFTC